MLFKIAILYTVIKRSKWTRIVMSKKADSEQIYGIPTLNSAFKWVLSEDSVRASFFHTFIPHVNI